MNPAPSAVAETGLFRRMNVSQKEKHGCDFLTIVNLKENNRSNSITIIYLFSSFVKVIQLF